MLIHAGGGAGDWSIKGIPSVIPYVNILLLNMVQAVIAIFLASDFLKRDKKLDTTDVIYVRSMTNKEYVFGKTLGNLIVFFILNVIILAIAMVFNMVAKNVEIDFLSYLYYFLIISIPTLIFILGLSFFMMSLVRNQAVTFLLLLIYVAVSLFYLGDKFYHLFDYMAYRIPLTFSDFVGFGNFKEILVIRGMYLFLGISFIFFTVVLMQRMPNSKNTRLFSFLWGICFLIGGIFLGFKHIESYIYDQKTRTEMLTRNDNYTDIQQLTVKNYNINIEHNEETIRCKSVLTVKNEKKDTLNKIVFALNPGLKVSSVLVNDKQQPFIQVSGIIELTGYSVFPQQEATLSFSYEGGINESSCYLDICDSIRNLDYRNGIYNIDKRYAFVTSTYLLLTREAGWYPIPGAGVGLKNKQWFNRQFSDYKLDVKVNSGFMAISQGQKEEKDDHVIFTSEHPLSEISLIVGDYEKQTVIADSLNFSVYVKKGHDYFSDFFSEIKDTIPSLISERIQDFERSVDLYYPFDRFSIVEVPVQFFTYDRLLTGMKEQMQPEMVLFGEKGVVCNDADFYGSMQIRRGGPGRGGRGNDSEMTPEDKKIQILQNFLSLFTREEGHINFTRSRGEFSVSSSINPYYAFPLFYDNAYFISSDQWPVMDQIFESYKKSSMSDNRMMGFMRDISGTSDEEKANIALMSQNFKEILNDPDKKDIVKSVMELKGETLFSIIKYKAGEEKFDDFLYDFLQRYQFKSVDIKEFIDEVKGKFNIDLLEYMKEWFNSKELPAFMFGPVNALNVLKDDEQMTMVNFKVTNTEKEQGVFTVNFRTGGGRGRGGNSSETIEKTVLVEGKQTKDITFLLEGTPRGITFNTLASKNIPNEIRLSLDKILTDNKIIPYEGEKIEENPVNLTGRNEIIVDNEDPGFSVTKSTGYKSLLSKILFSYQETTDSKYLGFNEWRAPWDWRLTTNSDFYGNSIRSAYYVRSGEGDKKAEWKIPLKKAGYYKVYVYIYKDDHRRRRDSDKGGYHYTVYSDNGEENIIMEMSSAEAGWNSLGSYHFSSDSAVVELTNQSESRMVIADAVKLEKQD